VVLAVLVSVTLVVVRGGEARRSGGTVPPFTAASPTRPTTASGGPPPSAPAQPLQPTPGNLLANGDFERDLGGWGVLGNGLADRVAVAHSGAWAVRIRVGRSEPGRTRSQRPGILAAHVFRPEQGRSYKATAWIHASRPGTEAALALREYVGGGQTGADVIGVMLPDTGWHEIAVIHKVHRSGARLTLEATAVNLRPGDDLLVDQVSITAS